MGIGTILKLTLALMTASLFVSVSTIGDLGSAISNGMDNIQKATDFTVEVDNVQTLSNASQFVRHRAGNDGCAEDGMVAQQNENGGYPALADSYMGQYPSCSGTSSTLVRGVDGAVLEEGQDMEGIYSRVRFEVTEPVVIRTSEVEDPDAEEGEAVTDGNTWLEERLVGVSKHSLVETTMSGEECDNLDSGSRFLGMGDHFVVYFVPDEASEEGAYRADKYMQEYADYLNNRAYCHPDGEDYSWGAITISELDQHPVISQTRRLGNKIVLCPGDRGYVQMNKAKPQSQDESGESIWSGSAANMPYIQVTNLGTSQGNTCLPAEMGPAAEFTRVENIQRIELPLEADSLAGSMIPDKFENNFRNFMQDTWEDSYADKRLDWLENRATDAASIIADGIEYAVDGLSSVAEGIADFFGLGDDIDTVGEFIEEEGLDPVSDFFQDTMDAVAEAVDGGMEDALHVEIRFRNNHLDMDDDAFPADFRGGFKVRFYESYGEGGDDINNQFETEPAAGLFHEDVPQGSIQELDALQTGWLGSNGINQLGCYVSATVSLEQNSDANMPPEDIWDVYIGDLEDAGSSGLKADCSGGRDGRIGDGDRGGESWGGTSTLEDLEIAVNSYDSGSEILNVEATATADESVGDGNLDDGTVYIGLTEGYSDIEDPSFEECSGTTCTVESSISGVSASSSPEVRAEFRRDDETTDDVHYVDMSEYVDSSTLLGEEHWNWDSEFNYSETMFNVSVRYGFGASEPEATNITGASLSLSYPSSEEGPSEAPSAGDPLIDNKPCGSGSEFTTECELDISDQIPVGGELTLNASIYRSGALEYDVTTFEVPFGSLGEASFDSVYNSSDNEFDLNVTYSSDVPLTDTDLALLNVTEDSEIGEKTCGSGNSCKLELYDIKANTTAGLHVNATLERGGATRYTVENITG
jgi:hypothetical protein